MKDPRFNWYPDNWTGGTMFMTRDQKGAWMELCMLTFYCLNSGKGGFTHEEAVRKMMNPVGDAAVDAAACAGLFEMFREKLETDGSVFWVDRTKKEFYKSKKISDNQSEKAIKRWSEKEKKEEINNAAAYAAGYAYIGIGNNNINKDKRVEKKLSKKFEPPLIEEVIAFFQENGYNKELSERAFKYYEDGKWHDSGGKPVKSWKQKMRGVWFTDKNMAYKQDTAETGPKLTGKW